MSSEVLLFGLPTCGPCKMLKSIMDSEGIEYKYVDCSAEPSIAQTFSIIQVPTLIVTDNGKELSRSTGLITGEELQEIING